MQMTLQHHEGKIASKHPMFLKTEHTPEKIFLRRHTSIETAPEASNIDSRVIQPSHFFLIKNFTDVIHSQSSDSKST